MSTEPEFAHPDKDREELPAADISPTSTTRKADNLPRRPSNGVVEEVLAMFSQSGPMRDPLLEKIGPKQIDRTLDIRASYEQNIHTLRMEQQKSHDWLITRCFLFLGFALVMVLGLCWMFLHYGKTDQVFNLLALIFAGSGGVGIGYGLRRTPNSGFPSNPSDTDANSG